MESSIVIVVLLVVVILLLVWYGYKQGLFVTTSSTFLGVFDDNGPPNMGPNFTQVDAVGCHWKNNKTGKLENICN